MSVPVEGGPGKSCIVTRVFLDTNVLAYLFDNREPKKRLRAQQVLLRERDLVVSTQVMLELFAILTRKFDPPLSAAEGERVLRSLQKFEVVTADANLVLRAARTVTEQQLSIWDAMVLEAAHSGGCAELWSEDFSAGAKLRGVQIVNPFAN